ncbi:MAG: 2OG-Fe(II) oxygenase family protein [Pseudomonadota bacterium]
MIPSIDLNQNKSDSLLQACSEWGFFLLRGHHIERPLIDAVLAQSQRFFSQPEKYKQPFSRTAENPWGYYADELTKNRKDWKQIFDIGPDTPADAYITPWPELEEFRDTMRSYFSAAHSLAMDLVDALATSLDDNANVRNAFTDHSSFLRLNYYPTCEVPAPADSGWVPPYGELGISHHTDAGALTVLLQDQIAGLQVYRAGRWHTVRPAVDQLVINVGDIVQVWSNDTIRAPLHRVLANRTHSRLSAAYFLNPAYAYDYAPLPACSQPEPRYRAINWGEFRSQRTAGDYADVGAEVQISNYRR